MTSVCVELEALMLDLAGLPQIDEAGRQALGQLQLRVEALLGLFLIVVLVRGLFWRGWCAGGRGSWKTGVPPAFEEWHRRAHQSEALGGFVSQRA